MSYLSLRVLAKKAVNITVVINDKSWSDFAPSYSCGMCVDRGISDFLQVSKETAIPFPFVKAFHKTAKELF